MLVTTCLNVIHLGSTLSWTPIYIPRTAYFFFGDIDPLQVSVDPWGSIQTTLGIITLQDATYILLFYK